MKQQGKILKQASKGRYIQVNIAPFRRAAVGGDVLTSNPDAFEYTFLGKYIFGRVVKV